MAYFLHDKDTDQANEIELFLEQACKPTDSWFSQLSLEIKAIRNISIEKV